MAHSGGNLTHWWADEWMCLKDLQRDSVQCTSKVTAGVPQPLASVCHEIPIPKHMKHLFLSVTYAISLKILFRSTPRRNCGLLCLNRVLDVSYAVFAHVITPLCAPVSAGGKLVSIWALRRRWMTQFPDRIFTLVPTARSKTKSPLATWYELTTNNRMFASLQTGQSNTQIHTG